MEYIAYKNFEGITAVGEHKSYPRGTILPVISGFIADDNKAVCTITSYNAFKYFANNEDGCGLQRGYLTAAIVANYNSADNFIKENYPKFINENNYFTFEFYNASIDDLRNIAVHLGIELDQVEALKKEVDKLKSENAALNEQLVDTQLAITELYEQLEGGEVNG